MEAMLKKEIIELYLKFELSTFHYLYMRTLMFECLHLSYKLKIKKCEQKKIKRKYCWKSEENTTKI